MLIFFFLFLTRHNKPSFTKAFELHMLFHEKLQAYPSEDSRKSELVKYLAFNTCPKRELEYRSKRQAWFLSNASLKTVRSLKPIPPNHFNVQQ